MQSLTLPRSSSGVAGTLAMIAYLRSQIKQKTEDNRRVKEIVQSVLSRLQDQVRLAP